MSKHQVAVADVQLCADPSFQSCSAAPDDEHHEFDTATTRVTKTDPIPPAVSNGGRTDTPRSTRCTATAISRRRLAWTPTRRTSVRSAGAIPRSAPTSDNPGMPICLLRTKRTSWALTYFEQPATIQELAFNQTVFLYLDPLTGKRLSRSRAGRVSFGSVDLFTH